MKLLFLPKYFPEGSSSRYRYYNYKKYFESANITVTFKPLLYNGYVVDLYNNKNNIKRNLSLVFGIINRVLFLLFNRKKYDYIIIEKELFTFVPFFIERFLLKGTKFIVDYDDNINARYQQGLSRFFLSKKIIQLANAASCITIGNHWYLRLYKDVVRHKIHYLPTVIDKELYENKIVLNNVDEDNDLLEIVWIGSLSTVKYLREVDDVLLRLQSRYNFRLKVIGAKIELKCNVKFVDWNPLTEIDELLKADIGIMPLENTDWEKGKCGFKLIQYMACGLPVVASCSVANEEIINSDCGYIAHDLTEWESCLSQLLDSDFLRTTLGNNGRRRVFNEYSYQNWAPKFIDLVRAVKAY